MAIKTMSKKLIAGKNAANLVTAEREALRLLAVHPNPFCLHLVYSYEHPEAWVIVMPLAIAGDLSYHLKNNGPFGVKRARLYAAEVALGLHHMHKLGILYRDLKPENVLLDMTGRCRISDMGLATIVPGLLPGHGGDGEAGAKAKGRAGTPGFWPPAMLRGEEYGVEADWWSECC